MTSRNLPDGLRPYDFHGVTLRWKEGSKEAAGDCPMCGREGKFGVETATSKSSCFVCEWKNGNAVKFLRWLWAESDKRTTDYDDLAKDRRIKPQTLMFWGVARSVITGDWLVPGYGTDGKLIQLYRYVRTAKGMLLLATPTFGHGLFGVDLYDKKKAQVYVCEGPWDAMALWETMGEAKETSDGLAGTANRDRSLLGSASVLAVPGCGVFRSDWLPLFEGKDVVLMYDSDHPKEHPKTGATIAPAGYAGMVRAAGVLAGTAKSVNYLMWNYHE